MSETIFTFPGKAGDAVMQWPIAYHWAKQTGKQFTCWMDEGSTKMVAPLFAAQPCVEKVEFKEGIESYNCGGQPWHFNFPTSEFEGREMFHLGLRGFPQRQLTLECLENSKVPVQVDPQVLAETPSLEVDGVVPANRLVLHGQPIYTHTRVTPSFWKFLSIHREELAAMFDEVVFVGSERDREIGVRTYPEWTQFDDGGDFLELARLMAGSRAVIGCGSSPVALAGALKIPAIRVHDNIEGMPKVIWSNLGDNQMNETEVGLRTSYPAWRDKWLAVPVG